MPRAPVRGQDTNPAPITRVVPATPAEGPAAVEPETSPVGAAVPASSTAGTAAPATGETAPAPSGTAGAVTGTAPPGSTPSPSPAPVNHYSIEIDLETQRAYLLKDGEKIAAAPISSGRPGHLTPTGNFEVIQKDLNHFSNLYGKIVEKDSGRLVKAGADVAMPVPKGCIFVPAPMKWFMRFDGATGMHAGILPGYPASHGCVRMPATKAEMFYETVEVGTPVHVFGTAPIRVITEEAPHRRPIAAANPTPVPTPAPRRGWWPFGRGGH